MEPNPESCSNCPPTRGQCTGYLGDACRTDGDCAANLTCRAESGGTARCYASCTVSADAGMGHDCAQKLGSGDLPLSSYAEIQPAGVPLGSGDGFYSRRYPTLSCIAGFCKWIPYGD